MTNTTLETILIVDDERNIVDLVDLYARQAGYKTVHAFDGQSAIEIARAESESLSLIVLDLMLPKVQGWDVCKQVRAFSDVPIVMLTARDDDVDKIIGLELGADDYLTKPFNPRELISRIKAILRRVNRAESNDTANETGRLQVGNLSLDRGKHEVWAGNLSVTVRAKEFDLLACLLENHDIVLTREKLLERVWGYDFAGETRTVDVHVAQLRKRIQASDVEIETVFGVGYKLKARPAAGLSAGAAA